MRTYINTVLGTFTPIITQLSNGDEVVSLDWGFIIGGMILIVSIYWIFKILYGLVYRK